MNVFPGLFKGSLLFRARSKSIRDNNPEISPATINPITINAATRSKNDPSASIDRKSFAVLVEKFIHLNYTALLMTVM